MPLAGKVGVESFMCEHTATPILAFPLKGEGVEVGIIFEIMSEQSMQQSTTIDLAAEFKASNIQEVLDKLDQDLVGLVPVKQRIREIAAYLLITKARLQLGIEAAKQAIFGKIMW